MTRRSLGVALVGAVAGIALAVVGFAMAGRFVNEGAAGSILLSGTTLRSRPQFVAGAGSMYLLVTVWAALLGLVVGLLTAGLAKVASPDQPRFRPLPLGLLGAGLAAVAGYATIRAGLGAAAVIGPDATSGRVMVTVSVFRLLVIVLVAGAVAGAVVAVTSEWLSRPEVLGLEGEAWPRSAARFVRESMAAMLIPILSVVGILAVVIVVSQAFLAGESEMAVALASIIAALVLAGAAFIAAHPPRRPDGD